MTALLQSIFIWQKTLTVIKIEKTYDEEHPVKRPGVLHRIIGWE